MSPITDITQEIAWLINSFEAPRTPSRKQHNVPKTENKFEAGKF